MFNTFEYNINAVSGTLRKSHPKSKFCIRELDDGKCVFDAITPRLLRDAPEIVILQIMLIREKYCLIEYVLRKDFEPPCGIQKEGADNKQSKGEWMYNTDDFTPKMRCSSCGYNKPLVAGESVEQEPSNFCPNCGAKMK